jgi:hypothetical protein
MPHSTATQLGAGFAIALMSVFVPLLFRLLIAGGLALAAVLGGTRWHRRADRRG